MAEMGGKGKVAIIPLSVRAELVEALFFLLLRGARKVQPFDKLRVNGCRL